MLGRRKWSRFWGVGIVCRRGVEKEGVCRRGVEKDE